MAEAVDHSTTSDELAGALEPAARLTPRERQILRCLAAGKTNRQIAGELTHRDGGGPISDETVGKHVSNILHKLGCSSRTQAATFAVRNGLD